MNIKSLLQQIINNIEETEVNDLELTQYEYPLIGQYVIVRTYSAGVFAGIFKARLGDKILLANCRRLWRWRTANGGISLSEVAVHGIGAESKICCVEPIKIITDIEISLCSREARRTIESAPEYKV